VLKVWHAEPNKKKDLVACLKDAGLESRYFKRILPGQGQQPEGYHGLPPSYASAWEPLPPPMPRTDSPIPGSRGLVDTFGSFGQGVRSPWQRGAGYEH
jgi:hypothetical protein